MDLISIDSLSDAEIGTILDRGRHWFDENRAGRGSNALAGRIVFNVFYENSTRTAMSIAGPSRNENTTVLPSGAPAFLPTT